MSLGTGLCLPLSWALTTPQATAAGGTGQQLCCGGQGPCCQEVGPWGGCGGRVGGAPRMGSLSWLQSPREPLSLSLSHSLCLCASVSLGLGARAARIYSELPGSQPCPWQWNQSLRKPPHQHAVCSHQPSELQPRLPTILSLLPNCFSEQAGCQTHPMSLFLK